MMTEPERRRLREEKEARERQIVKDKREHEEREKNLKEATKRAHAQGAPPDNGICLFVFILLIGFGAILGNGLWTVAANL